MGVSSRINTKTREKKFHAPSGSTVLAVQLVQRLSFMYFYSSRFSFVKVIKDTLLVGRMMEEKKNSHGLCSFLFSSSDVGCSGV